MGTILSLFILELCVRGILVPGHFKHGGYLLDCVIIFGSFIMEFTLHHSTGLLLTFFRLWRFVRILHGMFEYLHDVYEYRHAAVLLHESVDNWGKALERE